MGQKINPNGLRLGIIRTWDSQWFVQDKEIPALIKEDYLIRELINNFSKKSAISQIEIQRLKEKTKNRIKIHIHTAKPGVIIGRDGETRNKMVAKLRKLTQKDVDLNILEVKNYEKIALLIAQNIAEQLENRMNFRRVQKVAIQKALKAGVKGIKTLVSGRLNGAEIARSEGNAEGRVPLHTLRADIDYASLQAHTNYGVLGVKVWIFHGEVLPGQTILDTRKPFVSSNNRNSKRPSRYFKGVPKNVDAKKN
ncbi:30S ribosomal protein S3 ['Fragaria x ananassa' phyllody phytoplasma]|uniref:Small ribosomal subunit protein uS3 n=1 Tax='Fragaria x ananassa' phyllody phytoplasma TaxID=2358428 RepID=A0ABS5K338_9MOLU|nr:30S ribosomal protein S3 ['Fragaria x ananassa' phyllody phytoplasma]MBS2126306.1 30S ribosomal protein S3 ['Fragaria x ananassa' phyllody phytoplasma]